MTLREFISRLEEIEAATPGKDVRFETVEIRTPTHITVEHYLVGIISDEGGVASTIQVTSRPPQSTTDEV